MKRFLFGLAAAILGVSAATAAEAAPFTQVKGTPLGNSQKVYGDHDPADWSFELCNKDDDKPISIVATYHEWEYVRLSDDPRFGGWPVPEEVAKMTGAVLYPKHCLKVESLRSSIDVQYLEGTVNFTPNSSVGLEYLGMKEFEYFGGEKVIFYEINDSGVFGYYKVDP